MSHITDLLHVWRSDSQAREELYGLIYAHLLVIANARLRDAPGHSIQPAELVNEAYLKIYQGEEHTWTDSAHFYAFTSKVMVNFLRDYHKKKKAKKRGQGGRPLSLQDGEAVENDPMEDAYQIVDTFEALAREHPIAARVAELDFCGGLSPEQIVEILQATEPTVTLTVAEVKKHQALARAWILRVLKRDSDGGDR